MDVARQMRTVRGRNHPAVVPHLHVHRHMSRRLDDLVVVVVASADHRHVAGDAAFTERDVFGSVERVRLSTLGHFLLPLLRVRRDRWQLAAGRTGDERGPVFEPPSDNPEGVVIAGGGIPGLEPLFLAEHVVQRGGVDGVAECGVTIAVEQLGCRLLDVLQLFVRERRPAGEFIRPLQRCGRVVLPDARQIGMSIRGPGRRPPLACLGCGGLTGECDSCQRNRADESDDHPQVRETSWIHVPLLFIRTTVSGASNGPMIRALGPRLSIHFKF